MKTLALTIALLATPALAQTPPKPPTPPPPEKTYTITLTEHQVAMLLGIASDGAKYEASQCDSSDPGVVHCQNVQIINSFMHMIQTQTQGAH